MTRLLALLVAGLVLLVGASAQVLPIVPQYWEWRETVDPLPEGRDPLVIFREKLAGDGTDEVTIDAQMAALRHGLVVEEGEFYDGIYEEGPDLLPEPNRLLVEAAALHPGGAALDVGMGQGRNSVFLAQQGWQVTGFDPSVVGLRQAQENAAAAGVEISTVQVGAEYFEYGQERWDLIAILYPLEKSSVFRVRDALKPGGLVVVEAPHVEVAPYPHHYESNELLEIFRGFRILKYEDKWDIADWGLKGTRLVRLIAQKPL